MIFDDTSHLHVRHCEGFCQVFDPFGLFQGLLVDFAVKVGDGSIRPNGPCSNVAYVCPLPLKRNLDVCVLSPFLRKDLDADVVVFRGTAPPLNSHIVPVHLAVQIDGRSPRRFRHTGHL